MNESLQPVWAEYRQAGLFLLPQKSRKAGPRSGPSCREKTANTVHHPGREDGFKDGIPMVGSLGFGVLLWGRSGLGSWLAVSVEGCNTDTQGRKSFILPLFMLGARVYTLPGESPPLVVGCLGLSPSLQLLPSWSPMPCSTPHSGGVKGKALFCSQAEGKDLRSVSVMRSTHSNLPGNIHKFNPRQ